jgi:hypothetical protein
MCEAVRAIAAIAGCVGMQCRMRRHCEEVAALEEHPKKRYRFVSRLVSMRYGATDLAHRSPSETSSYFPNAFFSSGSISPFAAMGSRTSVSP